jgi:CHAT domain-containing protein
VLHSLPFAVLLDETGEPLVAKHALGVATSLTGLLTSSAALAKFTPDSVAAFSDGHDPKTVSLPRLAHADLEVEQVAQEYHDGRVYVGGRSTAKAFLSARQSVLHFSGHTVVNRQFPFLSELLFAPSPSDNGSLTASEIASHVFTDAKLVVLASCEGAAGTSVDGEGLISVATSFLAAGIPSAVAAIWPIDDREARQFFASFHRELRLRRDPLAALHATQLSAMRRLGPGSAIRPWAGFLAFGGTLTAETKGDSTW